MASFIPKILTSPNGPMTKRHTVKRILSVPPQHLYNIILDVDSYSSFLPYCQTSRVIRHSDCGTMFDAILKIGFGSSSSGSNSNSNSNSGSSNFDFFQEEYVSRVTKTKTMKKKKEGEEKVILENIPSSSSASLEWVVNARSIKSNLFDGLNSSWRLTEANVNNMNIGQNQLCTKHSNSNNYDDDDDDDDDEIIPNLANEEKISKNNNTETYTRNRMSPMTNVEFEVEISVSDPIISVALEASLEEVAKQQVNAFEKRCFEVPFREEE